MRTYVLRMELVPYDHLVGGRGRGDPKVVNTMLDADLVDDLIAPQQPPSNASEIDMMMFRERLQVHSQRIKLVEQLAICALVKLLRA